MALGVTVEIAQVVPIARPPPTPAAAQLEVAVQVEVTGYGEVSRW